MEEMSESSRHRFIQNTLLVDKWKNFEFGEFNHSIPWIARTDNVDHDESQWFYAYVYISLHDHGDN